MGYDARRFRLGGGLEHRFSDRLTADAGLQFGFERVTDALGTRNFSSVSLPLGLVWDNRDDPLNATTGIYVSAGLTPFLGFEGTGSGAQVRLDARAFYGIGTENRVVLAGRAQAGGVMGADICDTPRDLLFYSGGGGTVRGQPFRSLGALADCGGTEVVSGGQGFAALTAELRARVTDMIGIVAFADAGHVSEGFFTGPSEWHAGAGLGLRYLTGIGPIRVDVAVPVHGSTSDGVQLYIGIGQTF
jgi:translocation and assembly module TamA